MLEIIITPSRGILGVAGRRWRVCGSSSQAHIRSDPQTLHAGMCLESDYKAYQRVRKQISK